MKQFYALFFCVLFFMSCEQEETPLHVDQILANEEVASWQLVENPAGTLPNGMYQASLAGIMIDVRIENGMMQWVVPSLEEGNYHLLLKHAHQTHRVNVQVRATPLPANYLQTVANEFGLSSERIAQLEKEEQQQLAQFLKANESHIRSELKRKSSLQHTAHKTASYASLALGESRTFTVQSADYWNASGVYANAGESFQITAVGTWTDWYIDTDANGYSNWYLTLFTLLKRDKSENWFKLIATTNQRKNYPIGIFSTLRFDESGPLDFYANDANGFYWNNYGSITVTIKRIQ